MSKIDVYLVVEGTTEEIFIRDVLAPEMAQKGIFLYARKIGQAGHKGGNVRFDDRAKKDIGYFLRQRPNTYISIMVDYFKIDPTWPGCDQINQKIKSGQSLSSFDKAKLIEDETHKKVIEAFPGHDAKNRFIPYVSMHEFEALLFSDAELLSSKINVGVDIIQKILDEYANPEEINDDPTTAPSKRLYKLKQGYSKPRMGKEISEALGINKIRSQCPNFDRWLKRIEALAGQTL